MTRVAVTGANGHVGNNLCRLLIERGYQVSGLVHDRADALQGLRMELFHGSILDPVSLRDFVQNADVVIHTAAQISIYKHDEQKVAEINIAGTKNVLKAIQAGGNKRLIHFSSIHAMDPFPRDQALNEQRPLRQSGTTAYDASKIRGEQMVMDAVDNGLDAMIIAPTSVYGVHDHYPSLLGRAIIDLANGKVPALIPAGYDFVFVGDISAGVLSAMDSGKKGDKYIFSGYYHTLKELEGFIARETGSKKKRPVIPIAFLKYMLPFFTIQGKLSGKAPLLTSESIKALQESPMQVSCAHAENVLGYTRTAMAEGIHKTIRWMRDMQMLG